MEGQRAVGGVQIERCNIHRRMFGNFTLPCPVSFYVLRLGVNVFVRLAMLVSSSHSINSFSRFSSAYGFTFQPIYNGNFSASDVRDVVNVRLEAG
jgi:hypothetical protein